jgi:hypothetical protein
MALEEGVGRAVLSAMIGIAAAISTAIIMHEYDYQRQVKWLDVDQHCRDAPLEDNVPVRTCTAKLSVEGGPIEKVRFSLYLTDSGLRMSDVRLASFPPVSPPSVETESSPDSENVALFFNIANFREPQWFSVSFRVKGQPSAGNQVFQATAASEDPRLQFGQSRWKFSSPFIKMLFLITFAWAVVATIIAVRESRRARRDRSRSIAYE